jgi:hypothetical protein
MNAELDHPAGRINFKQHAALVFALGRARAALYAALEGETHDLRRVIHTTSLAAIASAIGCCESELAIVWDDYLSTEGMDRLRGWD